MKNKSIKENKSIENSSNIVLYSFDIFDTLITRKVATPLGIFAIMQNIMLRDKKYHDIPLYIRENFYEYRIQSERYQYSYNSCLFNYNDCSFDEIYENIKNNFGLQEEQIEKLKQLELDTEINYITPVKQNIELLKEYINKNKRVVLISDMYHSTEVIRKLLVKVDPIFENIKIYVSNELKNKKRGGKLYDIVKSFENVDFENWAHIGDNYQSDFIDANNKGIKSQRYNYPELLSYEKYAEKLDASNVYVQKLIGISKLTRIYSNDEKFVLGSSLASPILVPYVCWLINESIKKGYKKLYFIARDGYILKHIADIIIKKYKLPISTKYIYGSRLAWQHPSFHISIDNFKHIILQYGFRIDVISKVLDIEIETLTKILKKHLISKKHFNNYEEKIAVYNALIADNEFMNEVKKRSKDNCFRLIEYLKQEIDFRDDNFAFVDLCGSGVTQNCLASVINTFYNKPINSFYYRNGQYKVEALNVNRIIYMLRNEPCALLELLCRAPHGQTLGYKLKDNKYEPILEDYIINDWDFDNYLEGICNYTENYLNVVGYKCFDMTIAKHYLDWLFQYIDKKTSTQIGSFSYSHFGVKEKIEVASRISNIEALKILLGISRFKSDLPNLSYNRSSNIAKKLIDFEKKHQNLIKNIFYIKFQKSEKKFYIKFMGIKISLKRLIWGDKHA